CKPLQPASIRAINDARCDINDASNYRPITNLGTLSKILEQLAITQLQPYITGSPKFSPNQSAYRSAHSTETALLKIVNDIRGNHEAVIGNMSAIAIYICRF